MAQLANTPMPMQLQMAALLNGQHMRPHTKSEKFSANWQCPLGRPRKLDSEILLALQTIADTCTASLLKRKTTRGPGALHQMPPAVAAQMPQAMNLAGPQQEPQPPPAGTCHDH